MFREAEVPVRVSALSLLINVPSLTSNESVHFPFRQFGRLETSVQCLSVGALNSRERLHDSVQVSPSEFNAMLLTTVKPDQGLFLVQEFESLLAKKAIDSVPLPGRDSGFYSRYFLVPKKDRGLHPILELRLLNCTLQIYRFKMLMLKLILPQIQSEEVPITESS